MADYISDSPNPSAPAGHNQRTPSSAHPKRNPRNRKNNSQVDGTVSDGAVAKPASPRSKKGQVQAQAHKQRQSVASVKAVPIQQDDDMGRAYGQKTRPVSVGGNMIPGTPAKEQAYAASAFQASPAPSLLPMPRMLSRSVPNAAIPPSLQESPAREARQDGQSSSPESDYVSPAPPPREAQQSPLDIFFKADRAEKERMRNGSASMSPELKSRPPPPTGRSNMNLFQPSGKSHLMHELDGDDGGMPSPRTFPPGDRPPTHRQRSSPAAPVPPAVSDQERRAQSNALKAQLFNTIAGSTPPRDVSRGSSGSQTPEGMFGSPSPLQRSGPSTPQPAPDQQQGQYLHYNNRINLSPLFQKARADTPPRQSGLRQEVPSDADSGIGMQYNSPHPSSADNQTFARSYLKEQIRTSGPAEMPHLPWNSGPSSLHNSGHVNTSSSAPIPIQPSHAHPGVPSSTTPRSNGSQDIKGMENDLRRMLKLNNVLG